MSISRAFALCIAIAVGLEVLAWFVGTTSPLAAVLGWSKYVPLVLLGILLGRSGNSYATAFANAWPFVVLWTITFYLGVKFPDAPIPGDAIATASAAGFLPYLVFAVLSLVVAFVASALGIWLARAIWRRKTVDANAA